MRRLPLAPHESFAAPLPFRIFVEASRRRGRFLATRFEIEGEISALVLPSAGDGLRRDGLWRDTCLEAFIAPAAGTTYAEFNLSPSGDWAAYLFAGERSGMQSLATAPPTLASSRNARSARFDALFDLGALPFAPARAGLTMVIAHMDGARSYWALAHRRERPDFHDTGSFTLDLDTI